LGLTYKIAKSEYQSSPEESALESGNSYYQYKLNTNPLPIYHRLDMSINYKYKQLFKRPGELSLSVLNVYNRKNVLLSGENYYDNRWAGLFGSSNNGQSIYNSQLGLLPMLSIRINLEEQTK
jgi:hypothetical protein